MRTNFPETWRYLKAQRARNPRDDAIEEFTDYLVLGQPGGGKAVLRIWACPRSGDLGLIARGFLVGASCF